MQAPPNPFSTCRSRDDEEHGRQPCEPVERVAHDGPAVGAPRLRGGQPVAVHREPGAVPSKQKARDTHVYGTSERRVPEVYRCLTQEAPG